MTGTGASLQALLKKLVANPYMFQATVMPMSMDAMSRFFIRISLPNRDFTHQTNLTPTGHYEVREDGQRSPQSDTQPETQTSENSVQAKSAEFTFETV